MRRSSLSRFTIGQAMVAIAILASLLACQLVASPHRIVMVCLVGLLTALAVLHVLVESVIGPCPVPPAAAGRSDGWGRHLRFYRCSACRGRFKRFGFGPGSTPGTRGPVRFRKPTKPVSGRASRAPRTWQDDQRRPPSEQAQPRDLSWLAKHQTTPRRPATPKGGRRA